MPGIVKLETIVRETALGLRPAHELEAFDALEVRRAKAEVRWRSSTALAEFRETNLERAEVTYVATCEVVDRMGDLILTRPRSSLGLPKQDGTIDYGKGFLTEAFFLAGAPFLWSHLAREHAVGQVVKTKQARVQAGDSKVWATLQTVRYLVEEAIPFAVPTFILVSEGIARAVSIGAVPQVTLWDPDEQTRTKLGLGRWGVVYLTMDQLELSQAQTPANPYAVRPEDATKALELLESAVDTGREVRGVRMTRGLLADFRRDLPLTEEEASSRLRERCRGFIDFGAGETVEASDETEEPANETEGADELLEELEGKTAETPRVETSASRGGTVEFGGYQLVDEGKVAGAAFLRLAGRTTGHGRLVLTADPEVIERLLATLRADSQEQEEAVERGSEPPPPQPIALAAPDRALLERAFDSVCDAAEAVGVFCERVQAPQESRALDIDGPAGEDLGDLLRANLEATRRVLAIVEGADKVRGGGSPGEPAGAQAIRELEDLFR